MAAELTDSKPLARCPFCGGEGMRRGRFIRDVLPTETGCPTCKVWTDEAIWNKRASGKVTRMMLLNAAVCVEGKVPVRDDARAAIIKQLHTAACELPPFHESFIKMAPST